MNQNLPFSKTVIAALIARRQEDQWETFIVSMLRRLEISADELARAKTKYEELARQVANKLSIADTDVHIVVQGSMRTQTTISPRGNAKFDLDIVVKLTGSRFTNAESEAFFAEFGRALDGLNETTGDPEPRRRCWRLQYPGEPFYFDVTPAIPGSLEITGTDLRVRDPNTKWSPSNPEEYAVWFCEIASRKFNFQQREVVNLTEAKAQVDPIPTTRIGIDDVLRRTVQLMKLHRENSYYYLADARKEAMPISVILVTLAAKAYQEVWATRRNDFSTPLEVVLEIVEQMPIHIRRLNGNYLVENPKLSRENFADRWNSDNGVRAKEFEKWHGQLKDDLLALFTEDYNYRTENRIRSVFGQAGVDAWKQSLPKTPNVLDGLLATAPSSVRANPTKPTPVGSKNTLA
ncbi:MAG: nucleotidyltransferase [Betaproteobacteria bacterium]|nr:nucleotidyltransferase [Betaproteobacteria bacterium]